MPKTIADIVSPGRSLLYGTAVGLVFSLAATSGARATCSPAADGSAQVIVCDGTNVGDFTALGGDDIVTVVDDGEVQGSLSGGQDNDTVQISFGTVTSILTGGAQDDTVILGNGTGAAVVLGNMEGAAGADLLIVGTGGVAGSSVLGGNGDDIMWLQAGSIAGDANGGSGADQITLSGSSVTGDLLGATGNDVFEITGGQADEVLGQGGDDTFTMSGGTVNRLGGGQDNDTLLLSGGSVDVQVSGSAGDDTLDIGGTAIVQEAGGGSGSDLIVLQGTAQVKDSISGESGADTFQLLGGSVGSDVYGGSGADAFTLAGSSVTGDLLGGTGNDVFEITGGQADEVLGEGGDDTFEMSGGTVNRLGGGLGNDTLLLSGGSVDVQLSGSGGDDTLDIGGTAIVQEAGGGTGSDLIILQGSAQVKDSIFGDSGADIFRLLGGSVGSDVYGGSGADAFTLAGSSVTGDIRGDTGNDVFEITSGNANDLLGEGGDDTFAMSGGTVNRLGGGRGNDTMTVSGGSVDVQLSGSGGDDTLEVNGTAIVAEVGGGSGNDIIRLSGSAQITGTAFGRSGDDQFFLTGGSLDSLAGDSGLDSIEVDGTASIAGDILGGSGDDTIRLISATQLAGVVSGGDNNDFIEILGANDGGSFDGALLSDIDTLDGGAGTDDLIDFSGVTGQLPVGFEGFEWITLSTFTTLDIHDGVNDTRAITATGLGIFFESVLVADGNSPGVFNFTGNMGVLGTLEMRDGEADDQVNVSGDFANGVTGVLGIDAALDATALADRLTIGGSIADVQVDVTLFQAASMAVAVTDVGNGQGALTGDGPGNGIAVIDVSATGNTAAGDFFLLGGPIQAGAVEYDLSLESDGIWYLQSVFLDQVFGYAAAPSAAVAMGQEYLASLRERVGTREQSWTGGAVQSSEGTGVWLRGGGNFSQVEDGNGFDYDQDHWFAQAGADFPLLLDPNGPRLIGGLFAHYGTSDLTAPDETGADAAKGTLDAWGGGLSLTWYGSPEGAAGLGLYADLVGQVSVYDAEVKADDVSSSTDGWGFGVSLEAGWGFEIGKNLRLIPQAQLAYTQVRLDDFTDSDGIEVDYGTADSLEGRIGFAVDSGKLWRSGNVTFDANLVHEFLGESELAVSGLDAGTDLQGTAAEIGLGGTVSLLDNVSLYADVDYRIPLDEGRQGVSASFGVRVSW